ncbi:hypothetical protein KCV01_g1487, partial [Aureobasidium melanogenum]
MRFRQKAVSRVLCALYAAVLSQAAIAGPAPQATDYDAQDTRLNVAYKALSQGLGEASRKALRDEERQWISERDKACGVSPGQVLKNECTTAITRSRADELEHRAAKPIPGSAAVNMSAITGDWGYRTDCGFGHYVNLTVSKAQPEAEGTWADGTRNDGGQGKFKGQWRDGKLYVRFCSDDPQNGDFPACPAYDDGAAYFSPQGKQLVWFQQSGRTYDRYVALDRVPKGGKAPLDTHCKDDDR